MEENCLRTLGLAVFKTLNNLNPAFMKKKYFTEQNN